VERLGRGADAMNKYNLKQSVVIVVVGFAVLLMCLYCFVFPLLVGGGPEKIPRIRIDEKALSSSIENYHQTFGSYPNGENSNVVRVLTGDNPQKTVFLNFRQSTEHPDEMVDSWGTPYQIEFVQQTNFVIRSAGKDKIWGDKDDIIFNSTSNDFVKP
jgi:hypothetical protein